jgi:HEAT repeat protein
MTRLLLICLVTLAALPLWSAPLTATFDDKGLATLAYRDTVLAAPDAGRFLVFIANLKKDNEPDVRFWNPKPAATRFNADTHTLVETYPWAEVSCRYDVDGTTLTLTLTAKNTGELPIANLQCIPLRLKLPRTHANLHANASELGTLLEHDAGRIGFFADGHGRAQMYLQGWGNSGKAYPIITEMVSAPVTAKHPVVDNRYFSNPGTLIAPGESAVLRVRLFFGDADATLARLHPRLNADYAQAHPMTLAWNDRRPIGTIFYAHPGMHWQTNPRGFNFGKAAQNDVFSEEGRKQFEEAALAYADRCLANLKAMHAQGVIVWDLEGEEMHHMISYVGDPRRMPEVAPEMDRVIDAFMKKFTDAGLKVGITIRPTEYFEQTPGKRDWSHREVADPVALMSEKIAYARKRWGCTLFYLDSNVFSTDWVKYPREANVPWTMPVAMIKALHEKHPDVLVIPEWSNLEYHRYSAPYASCNIGQLGSNPVIRGAWPASFQVVAVNTELLERHWDTYVANVQGGDVLFFPCWYPAAENTMVEMVYREAAYRTAMPKSPLATAALLVLLKEAASPDEAVRYIVASRLGDFTTPEALGQTAAYLDDASLLVRKCALGAIARHGAVRDPAVVDKLLALLQAKDPGAGILRAFVGTALGKLGETAAPRLVALAAQKGYAQRYAVQALGATGTKDAQAVETLLPLAADPANAALREDAITALGHLKAVDAVPPLLAILAEAKNSESLRQRAVIALGRIGDPRAIEPLIAEFKHGYATVVVYAIRRNIDDALAAITGQKYLVGADDWQKWWVAQPKSVP